MRFTTTILRWALSCAASLSLWACLPSHLPAHQSSTYPLTTSQIKSKLGAHLKGYAIDSLYAAMPPHTRYALGFIGYTESGNNRGAWVDRWNGINDAGRWWCKACPYCATFTGAALNEGGALEPTYRGASSRVYITSRSIPMREIMSKAISLPSGTLLIWVRKGGGHIGQVVVQSAVGRYTTIEANTSPERAGSGSEWNGGGVYMRNRRYEPYNAFRLTHATLVTYPPRLSMLEEVLVQPLRSITRATIR